MNPASGGSLACTSPPHNAHTHEHPRKAPRRKCTQWKQNLIRVSLYVTSRTPEVSCYNPQGPVWELGALAWLPRGACDALASASPLSPPCCCPAQGQWCPPPVPGCLALQAWVSSLPPGQCSRNQSGSLQIQPVLAVSPVGSSAATAHTVPAARWPCCLEPRGILPWAPGSVACSPSRASDRGPTNLGGFLWSTHVQPPSPGA